MQTRQFLKSQSIQITVWSALTLLCGVSRGDKKCVYNAGLRDNVESRVAMTSQPENTISQRGRYKEEGKLYGDLRERERSRRSSFLYTMLPYFFIVNIQLLKYTCYVIVI